MEENNQELPKKVYKEQGKSKNHKGVGVVLLSSPLQGLPSGVAWLPSHGLRWPGDHEHHGTPPG